MPCYWNLSWYRFYQINLVVSLKLQIYQIYYSYNMKNYNSLNPNPTKWSNTLKQFVCKLPTDCLSVFEDFVGLALKGIKGYYRHLLKMILSPDVKDLLTVWPKVYFHNPYPPDSRNWQMTISVRNSYHLCQKLWLTCRRYKK